MTSFSPREIVSELDRYIIGQRDASPDYRALVERAILFDVTGWSDNCASHIFPRYDAALLMPAFERLERRIHDLEARLRALGEDPGPFEMPE